MDSEGGEQVILLEVNNITHGKWKILYSTNVLICQVTGDFHYLAVDWWWRSVNKIDQ